MTIQGAFFNALTSLNAQQAEINNISNNVGNANNAGYSNQILNETALVFNGVGQGVATGVIQRAANASLTGAANQANGAQAYSQQMTDGLKTYSQAITQSSGASTDDVDATTTNILSSSMANFQSALTALSGSAGDATAQNSAVSAASDLVNSFHDMDSAISSARETADSNIADGVNAVNTALNALKTNDAAIKKAMSLGQSTASLQDTRDQLVASISQYVPVKALDNHGSTVLVTDGGTTLFDGGVVHALQFSPTASIPDEMRVTGDPAAGTTGGLSQVTVDNQPIAMSQSGSIAANLQLRDVTLPQFSDQMDELAGNVISQFQSTDPTVTASNPTGLFTVSGSARTSSTTTPGLAREITLNSSVDPDAGGSTWRIQAGANATSQGQASDSTVINGFLAGMTSAQTYSPASGLSATNMVTASSQIAGSQQSTYATWSTRNDSRTAQAQDAQTALTNATGVNVDDQMQRLLLVQQTYAASSQVIQAAAQMLSTINSVVSQAV